MMRTKGVSKLKRLFALIISAAIIMTTLGGCEVALVDESMLPSKAADDGSEDESDGILKAVLVDNDYFYQFSREIREREVDEDAITIAFVGGYEASYIIRQYMLDVGNVNIQEYITQNNGHEALNTKLLAKDTDIDIYVAFPYYLYSNIVNSYYEDLSQFDSLKERFDNCNFAKSAASYNGELVGVPVDIIYSETVTNTVAPTLIKYCIRNLSALNGEYKDEDGKELYDMLKHLRDEVGADGMEDPTAYIEDTYYLEEYRTVAGQLFMMNPFSKKKEQAAEFLAFAFDVLNQDIPLDLGEGWDVWITPYPEIGSTDEVHLYWDYYPWVIAEPIARAYNEVCDGKTNGKNKTLKKLAEEAARNVRMRLDG